MAMSGNLFAQRRSTKSPGGAQTLPCVLQGLSSSHPALRASSLLQFFLELLRQDDVGGKVRCGVLRALVAEADRIDTGEEVFAPA